MRIVAIADTHLFHRGYEIPDGDVLVHAGDICRRGSLDELGVALHWFDGLSHKTKIVVAGNHDWAFAREHERGTARAALVDAGILYLEDEVATVEGLRVYGTPWQPEFMSWAFNLPRGPALAEKWSAIPAGLDLLITHGPPAWIGDCIWDGSHVGCVDLRARVMEVRPRVHAFGHIHNDGGVWQDEATLFANVTSDECGRSPTVIDITPDAVRVVAAPPRRRPFKSA
jgi:Icc-related predicted phosphoesterase